MKASKMLEIISNCNFQDGDRIKCTEKQLWKLVRKKRTDEQEIYHKYNKHLIKDIISSTNWNVIDKHATEWYIHTRLKLDSDTMGSNLAYCVSITTYIKTQSKWDAGDIKVIHNSIKKLYKIADPTAVQSITLYMKNIESTLYDIVRDTYRNLKEKMNGKR